MTPLLQIWVFLRFAVGFVVHALLQQPLLLLLLLLVPVVTLVAWRLLSSLPPPSPLASARSCLLLLLLLLVLLYQNSSLQARLGEVEAELEDSSWALRQGQQHRTQLLERLTRQQPEQPEVKDVPQENPLDGCLHVFLDLGSNRGLQIRKLYEPHLFPLAPVLPLYERYFGQPDIRNNQQICAVGFEPNPAHTAHLQAVAANYSTCGIKVIMFTETGVSNKDAVGSFAADLTIDDNDILHDGGARFVPEDQSLESLKASHFLGGTGTEVISIKTMRVAKYITDVVATRKLPLSAEIHRPRVVVKSDIEGAELEVLTDMVVTGALAVVDNLHMEWHGVEGPGFTREGAEAEMITTLAGAMTALGELTGRLGMEEQFLVEDLDDETYSGVSAYGMFGDFTLLPTPTC